MEFKWLKRSEIDEKKWDDCIKHSANGHVFAQSWYLDIVCDDWQGVVADDYEAVLPLPLKRIGFQTVYCPHWTPYLGIINQKPINKKAAWLMLQTVPYFNINLVMGTHNKLPGMKALRCEARKFAVLDLISEISRLEKRFKPELKPIIELYKKKKINVVRAMDASEYLNFVNRPGVYANGDELPALLKMISFALRYKSAGLYAAYDERNQMVAGAFLLKSDKKLSLIHCGDCSSNLEAVKAIIFHILDHNAGSNLTLEFPFYSDEVGRFFTANEHVCLVYKKGLPKWISLFH
ncbi:hypothetical protein J1N10_11000 [Carboxylicivirga sp. A043]|uniref:hypothetical protein n=1 Tax=Carboxylicivirga litoralis TaxID=2816963 RepID=UPI0021CB6420|nr:hypothetical protein [Carboxylicivirga sp. A043]MCU4156508.1 hypothetical protein [Carboxylicivirga sp. A043]